MLNKVFCSTVDDSKGSNYLFVSDANFPLHDPGYGMFILISITTNIHTMPRPELKPSTYEPHNQSANPPAPSNPHCLAYYRCCYCEHIVSLFRYIDFSSCVLIPEINVVRIVTYSSRHILINPKDFLFVCVYLCMCL